MTRFVQLVFSRARRLPNKKASGLDAFFVIFLDRSRDAQLVRHHSNTSSCRTLIRAAFAAIRRLSAASETQITDQSQQASAAHARSRHSFSSQQAAVRSVGDACTRRLTWRLSRVQKEYNLFDASRQWWRSQTCR